VRARDGFGRRGVPFLQRLIGVSHPVALNDLCWIGGWMALSFREISRQIV
jgi:hypothetical protein